MCHDTSTSDKFYALHLGPLQARERRRLFERALVEEEEEEEEDGEAAGTESPPRKGRKRTETSVSPLVKITFSLAWTAERVALANCPLCVSFPGGNQQEDAAMAPCQREKPGRSPARTNRRL